MSEENEQITHRIKSYREMDFRNLENCASFIDVPAERFKQIEENEHLATLPEIELLSVLFQTPISTLLEGDANNKEVSPFYSSSVRKKYKRLRNRMILAKIELACKKQNISIQELFEKINLPGNAVKSYEDGIPMDHLTIMCEELSMNIESLFDDAVNPIKSPKGPINDEYWEPEFRPEPPKAEPIDMDDDDFDNLVRIIKKVPKDEQALLARILLEELGEF